jgi:hypothetical protein
MLTPPFVLDKGLMKPKGEISLIFVKSILQLKLGNLLDVYAAGSGSDDRYRRHLVWAHAS